MTGKQRKLKSQMLAELKVLYNRDTEEWRREIARERLEVFIRHTTADVRGYETMRIPRGTK